MLIRVKPKKRSFLDLQCSPFYNFEGVRGLYLPFVPSHKTIIQLLESWNHDATLEQAQGRKWKKMHYCLQPSKDEIVNMHALSSCAFIKVSSMSNLFWRYFFLILLTLAENNFQTLITFFWPAPHHSKGSFVSHSEWIQNFSAATIFF